ncbi:hypothetical protein SAMN05518672_107135 [Chitinophaga sp. CF118]|uniref:hypothetical protein n=1 Tax=Chitinophaga sp. CF118 TaxID=1884367 RepID=UPI0008DECD7C|nr:hypothetical protein [Chitinophaga sp. CF118]SFE53721.1 hypothetical protein SAMN05518672_107135 [Chitinophaga sp. CF118]
MKKILVLSLLAFTACKKDNATVQQLDYKGKWNISRTISKEYTLNNGDTIFTKNDTSTFEHGAAYIDFQLNNKGGGDVLLYRNGGIDSMSYEAMTHAFFHLDSTLCEITSLADSSFNFNTLIFDNTTVPDKIQVTQDFFILSR